MKRRHNNFKKYLFAFLLVAAIVAIGAKLRPATVTDSSSQKVAVDETKDSTEAKQAPVKDAELEKLLNDWAGSHPGEYGIVVRELTGKERTASYRADKPMIAASTYKLFLTYVTLYQIERGELTLDTPLSNGQSITNCMDNIILYSYDACTWEMGDLTGWSRLDQILHEQGFKNTNLNNYDANGNFTDKDKFTTASDEAELLMRLERGKLLNKMHSEMMLSRMKRQTWRQRIPAGVPEGVEVADKPGWIYAVQNDAAIVYGPKSTYILVILSDKSSIESLANLSEIIYEYLQK